MKQNEYVDSICDRNHENCNSCPLNTQCHKAPAFSAGLEAHDMWQAEMNRLATRLVGIEILLRAVYNK